MTELITEQLNNLSIKPKSNVLYYKVEVNKNLIIQCIGDNLPNAKLYKYNNMKLEDDSITISQNILNKLKDTGYILYLDNKVYKLNSEFHITILYLKGNPNEEILINKLNELLNKEYSIIINRIGISDEYIVFGVGIPDELLTVYGGNPIIHITCGCIIYEEPKQKSPPPVNSPSAFNKQVIKLDDINITGKLTTVCK